MMRNRIVQECILPYASTCVTITMPQGAEILYVSNCDFAPTMFALVDPDRETEEREFIVVESGEKTSTAMNMVYCGSCIVSGWWLHVFELVGDEDRGLK